MLPNVVVKSKTGIENSAATSTAAIEATTTGARVEIV